ncbi:MAG: hypothetical protein H7039_21005 [Bryobacteraceae bacterium]|nr:hypothetical protein [Bryobacteraceae bacterium]
MHIRRGHMCHHVAFAFLLTCLSLVLAPAFSIAATLEKLSVEAMSLQSTAIVRGRVSGCVGEGQGSLILTRCRVRVAELWKGERAAEISFVVPGGSFRGLVQNFTGAPKLISESEYVLFLWTGKSGRTHVIGLSQGVFNVVNDNSGGPAKVRRAASSEQMLDSSGQPVADASIQMGLAELRSQVQQALGRAAR